MSSILCDSPNCGFSASQKCSTCGGVFCVKHIQLFEARYLCDRCLNTIAEHELFRFEAVEAYIKDKKLNHPICIVTNKRIIFTTALGSTANVLFSEIEAVRRSFVHLVDIVAEGNTNDFYADNWLRLPTRQERDRVVSQINQARALSVAV